MVDVNSSAALPLAALAANGEAARMPRGRPPPVLLPDGENVVAGQAHVGPPREAMVVTTRHTRSNSHGPSTVTPMVSITAGLYDRQLERSQTQDERAANTSDD